MNDSQMQDVSDVIINSLTEEECAYWRCQQGAHIVRHRDRYWEEVRPGFFQPIHLLARLSSFQATRPTKLCWGFRAALCDDDIADTNGTIPIYLLSDVTNYDLHCLPQKRRTHVRKCRKLVKIVRLVGSALLQQQGYEVVCSSLQRTQHMTPPSKKNYLANLTAYTTDSNRLVLAGLIGNKLGGYIDGYAVDGTAYMVNGYYATEALPSSIVTGLTFEFVQICRRCTQIHQIVDGLHSREIPALSLPKKEMGFPVKHIPAKVRMNPIAAKFIQWRYPHIYYRLTGKD